MKVVVVGAGVIGLCTAWSLTNDGHEVAVLSEGPEGADSASCGNSGIIVPSHFVPLAAPGMIGTGLRMMLRRDSPFRIVARADLDLLKWCRLFQKNCSQDNVERGAPVLRDLHMASRQLFLEFAREFGNDFGLETKGMLMLCKTEHGLTEEAETASQAQRLGLQAKVLDSEGVAKLDPGLRYDVLGGVHFADDAHLAPHIFLRSLRRELTARGVTFKWSQATFGLQLSGNVAVPSTIGHEGDHFVLAAGSWTGRLTHPLGLKLPLQPGKGMHVSLVRPERSPGIACLLKEARIAVTPMDGGVRFGGTMELGEWRMEPDTVRRGAMVRNIGDYLPDYAGADFDASPTWTGLRPCSPDGLPYIGRTRFATNVSIATGHGMMGLSLGPVTGRLVSDELAGKAQPPLAVSPDRFSH